MPQAADAIRLRGIRKSYPRVVANDGVDLTVKKGSIHALVGENGAGKSTLMKILYGMVRPDQGSLELNGRTVQFESPRDAIAAGVGMVHQHFMLVRPLTVYENVVLGSEPGGFVWNRTKARAEVERISKEFGISVDAGAAVETLSVGEEQRVEILKVLFRGARLLILDEPTAVLTPQECEDLFTTLRKLRDAGDTIVFISHKLKEVMALCDEVTVMRRGKSIGARKCAETSLEELARMMVGDIDIKASDASSFVYKGEKADALSLDDVGVGKALVAVDLTVKAGEVLGVAGVEGNGQRELAEAVCGLRAHTGTIKVAGRIGYVPEDRHKHGLMLSAPAWENVLLGRHWERIFSSPISLHRGRIDAFCREIVSDYDVRPPDTAQEAGAFSGGNQQKLVVGREIAKQPKVLVIAHPTRGVDLGASALIHDKILRAKAAGCGVLLISADLDEVLALSDRIAVLYSGRIMGVVKRSQATIERLGSWMAGIK
jgi:general nucleoside transport system ATP-binding protein